MQRGTVFLFVVVVAAGAAGCSDSAARRSSGDGSRSEGLSYAGLQHRPIKALAPERVDDLLAGRGAGYALAAELNHHPGPRHVLELSSELRLEPGQEAAVREVFASMEEEARRLGRHLVDLEAQLDRTFAGGTGDSGAVAKLTGDIGATEGRLRAAHLSAHVRMVAILTPGQIARYDELRGYTGASGSTPSEHRHQPGTHDAGESSR